MHAAAIGSRLRGAATSRHSAASAVAISSSRLLAPCCVASASSYRLRQRLPAPAAPFHTSRPLFAPADLSSSSVAVSSEVETATHDDSPTPTDVPESQATSGTRDHGHQHPNSASESELASESSRSAGRVSFSTTATASGRKSPNRSPTLSNCEPSSSPSSSSPSSSSSSSMSTAPPSTSTALVKTNTVTLVSPSTGTLSAVSTVNVIPSRTISLASAASSAFRAPEAVAVARGLRVLSPSNSREGKAVPSIKKVWLLEEGKRFHDSIEAAERDMVLDRPDCSSRVLDFAAVYGEAKEALVVSPMELVMWVADTLRPTDPGIDEYLNLVLFPDLNHHTFSGTEEFCWSSTTRPASEPSPPSSPSRAGRSTPATRSLAARQVENDRRFSNIRAVLDRGAALLSKQVAASATTPVLILDHAGIFIGSPQGHTLFDALEASLKYNLLPWHPSLRTVYNVTGPSQFEFAAFTEFLEEINDEFPQIMWHRPAPDALALRLDPDVHLNGSRLVLHVFCAHWQAQYIDLRLRRAQGVSADARKAMVDAVRGVLGEARWRTHQLDLVALAMIGLDSEARAAGVPVSAETIEGFAESLLGKAATREAREQVLKRALEAEVRHKERMSSSSPADEDEGPHGFPHPSMHGNALPFVRPESISITLDDVVGQTEAKQALDALITLPMKHPAQFSSGVLSLTSAAGVLLYGPPGTGKTMLAKAVAKSAGASFIAMNPSDIQDKFVGESEKTIKRLFETARRKAPCVIFLDEVDALFSKRDFDMAGYRRDILNEFCMQWDGIKGSKNVILLGATNRPFDLDEAVLRRFSRRVLVDLPSPAEKRQLLINLLKDETLDSPDLIDTFLVPKLVHHSASDIMNVAIAAAMAAVREHPMGPRVLGLRHFEVALKEVRPSVSNAMDAIVKLREFASTMEGGGNGLKRVGFNFAEVGKGLVSGEGRTRELVVPRG